MLNILMLSFRKFLTEMAAQYTPISQEEMEEFLKGLGFHGTPMNDLKDQAGQPLISPNVRELVYGKRAEKDGVVFAIRVYTGIEPGAGSRGVGKDAIRVEVFCKDSTGKTQRLGGSKRVHRTQNWRKNLRQRIDNWTEVIGPPCAQCGSPTVERENKKTKETFFGCSRYPACKGGPAKAGSPQAAAPDKEMPWDRDDRLHQQGHDAQQPPQQRTPGQQRAIGRQMHNLKQEDAPTCPGCGAKKVPRVNGKTQEAFWGCPNWKRDGTGCNGKPKDPKDPKDRWAQYGQDARSQNF